ncbi:efflux RND transporter periplasmic adaptor subunit [Alteromonas sp. a30]|uniref:efflux RND transporter periplasmic adaptor subunit n=1 Tax=Alteromonas sp. a30 TaxID=2730917 RepID=UPI002281FB1D|nr:efflux RND transporter periplasmic adaptor subunit [Alteromonas sp. a30]MCY7293929.1 efflux RND transporter periplasmic adaptor subunit [Alteromonas sp. a30]
MSQFYRYWTVTFSGLALLTLSACGTSDGNNQPSAATPPEVVVAHVVNERITEWDEYTARLQAPKSVVLQPRVSGYINSINFQEGSLVKKGEALFSIDDRTIKAEIERLNAQKVSAQSRLTLAQSDVVRARKLEGSNAISKESLDNRTAALAQAQGDLAAIEASLKRAYLELSFAQVTSPVDGKVANALVTEGNYVSAGQSVLTTIVSTKHMYAYFDVDEQSFLEYTKSNLLRSDAKDARQPVFMALSGETDYAHQGVIDFINNSVNETTGSIRLRATFDNLEGSLIPGLFARLRVAGSESYVGTLIDDKAIGTDLNRKYVLKVSPNNELVYQAVELGEKIGGLRIVKSGLSSDDTIVINGLHRVRDKMTITPVVHAMASQQQIAHIRNRQARIDDATTLLASNASQTLE